MWYFLDPFQAHWAVGTIQLLVAVEPTFLLAIAGVLVCGGPLSKPGSFSPPVLSPRRHPSITFAILYWLKAGHRYCLDSRSRGCVNV